MNFKTTVILYDSRRMNRITEQYLIDLKNKIESLI